MDTTIWELLNWKALGRVKEYKHKKAKENLQCTKLQDFLSAIYEWRRKYDSNSSN